MKYRACFLNHKGLSINGFVEDLETNPDHFFALKINGITIETDGFETLSIDNPDDYSAEQLHLFDYEIVYPYKDKTQKLIDLKNYQLETFIPINVFEIKSEKLIEAEITITLKHNGKNIEKECTLLGKTSNNVDLETAFQKIQHQLSETYKMRTCSNCKNSTWHPYGGSEFINQLCFVKEASAFQKIEPKDKMSIVEFMKFDEYKNFENVVLTHICDKFEYR